MRLFKLAAPLLSAALLYGCSVSSDPNQMSTATLLALQAVGLQVVQPMPAEGCTVSAIPPEKVVELLMAVPEAQRVLLAQVLDATAVAWSVQLYTGAAGTGLCFPVQNVVILLPAAAPAAPAAPAPDSGAV